MAALGDVAAAFVEMAHRIVWASAATVDARGRPRSRILHPFWEWNGQQLVGWIATSRSPVKAAHLGPVAAPVAELLDAGARHLRRGLPGRVAAG
jgi:hypothetical protein